MHALMWQEKQMGFLQALEAMAGEDTTSWGEAATYQYLLDASVATEADLSRLPEAKLLSLGKDLANLHRIFRWTFESMPDDAEAIEISKKNNFEAGHAPPSPPPLAPTSGSPSEWPLGEEGGGSTRRRRKRVKRSRDEL